MNDIKFEKDKIYIKNVQNFDLTQTLDCGQAFRWSKDQNNVWHGIAYDKYIELYQDENDIVINGCTEDDFKNIWQYYFDLDRDYDQIIKEISADEMIAKAAQYSSGIRLLNQEPWEALCSFIISQNNNIPRIKKIVDAMCQKYGHSVAYLDKTYYSFPDAKALLDAGVEEIFNLKTGFRAKYIIDACEKIANGKIDLDKFSPITYDPVNHTYRKIGEVVGRAFSDGKKIK